MPPTPSQEHRAAQWRGDWSCCCQRIPQTAPNVFFFLRESSCSILPLHTRKGLSSLAQPTSPVRPGNVRVRAPHHPTLNSPQPAPTVSVCLPLRPYSLPCDFKQPGLSWCCSSLVWQGREPLTRLSPWSPTAGPEGEGLGLQSPWSLHWSQGPFSLKQSPYCLFFQCTLYFLVSYLHKRWGTFGCLLCSSVDLLGVSPKCRGKWTYLAAIFRFLYIILLINI